MGDLLHSVADLASPWAYVVVALLAALEAAAFMGLFVPGETVVLLGGVLASQGRVGLAAMMAVAATGAVVGDSIGYEIGRHFGPQLRRSRLGRRVGDERWDRGSAYLERKGGRAIFLGRFVGVLRAIVPALAGVARMPYRRFLGWNVAGGVTWACGLVALGYAAGGSYRRVEGYAGDAGLILAGIVVVVGGIAIAGRWASRHEDDLRAQGRRQLERPRVARVRARFATQLDFLGRRLRPRGALGLSLTLALVAIVAAGWLFGAVLEDAMTGNGIGSIDAIAVTYLAEHRTAWLTSLMRGITAFGGSAVALPLVILAGGLAASRTHRWQNLAAAVVTTLGANLLSRLVKVLVHRPRPPVALAVVHPDQYAFPSGHAITAVVAYGTIAYLACRALPRWRSRVAVWTGAAAIMALVGMSRVYLGAHWPSDVVGGWALGALWLGLAYTAITALAHAGSPHSGGGGDHTEDRAGVAPRR